jgi:hypothetical protein
LGYGDTSSGKTTALLSVAAFHQKRGSDARFFVISSGDLAYEQMLAAPKYEHLTNIEWADCWEYGEWNDAAKDYLKRAKKRAEKGPSEYWLVVDLYSALWGLVQQTFIDNVADKDGEDFWTAAAKRAEASTSGWELNSDINWQFSNKIYGDIQRTLGRWPGHVMALASSKPVDKDRGGKVTEDDPNIADWFGRLGEKPAGQKEMAYEFRDIVYFRRLGSGDFVMSTAKGREREKTLKGVPHNDFFRDFLIKVAGWRP